MIKEIQRILGVTADGVWGPKSQAALNREIGATKKASATIKRIQQVLGTEPDGQWGVKSQAALDKARGGSTGSDWKPCKASSFADPADVAAFNRCKATGKSDVQCFAVGDNGIGQFGKITAQTHTPMVAVHKTEMVSRWGSVIAAAHRPVKVRANGITIDATVEDRISAPGRIDLNPACAKLLGLKPPFMVPCEWKWT